MLADGDSLAERAQELGKGPIDDKSLDEVLPGEPTREVFEAEFNALQKLLMAAKQVIDNSTDHRNLGRDFTVPTACYEALCESRDEVIYVRMQLLAEMLGGGPSADEVAATVGELQEIERDLATRGD